jgi:cation transport protein ChaC
MTAADPDLPLTRALIAAAFPTPVADDHAAMPTLPDHALDALIETAIRGIGTGDDFWVFAYGALMWKPEFAFEETRLAMARGWHRRFCLWQWRYRGTRERPALMLALDRGGACNGLAYRIAGPDPRAKLDAMFRRELGGDGYRPRWLRLKTVGGPVRALGFVINHQSPRYAGALPDETIARYIATACGHIGPSAEYLLETARACAALGIEDRMLARLQRLVAANLRTVSPPRR